jgi:integrase
VSQSTRKPASRNQSVRPPKPYPGFPLSPHPSGKWQKKINGRIFYYGRWGKLVDGTMTRLPGDGWKEALALYEAVREDDHTGRERRAVLEEGEVKVLRAGTTNPTIADLCNQFLTAKTRQKEAGELSARMFAEYKATTDRMVAAFGKARPMDDLTANDFAKYRAALAKQFGPVRVGNEVQKVRTVFKYGTENGLIEKAVRFGSEFKKPDKKVMRLHRAKTGKKLFTADVVRALVAAAGVPLRAMILLGVNAAFGNNDVGTLPLAAVDLLGGWITFPRPKTGIERKAKLWPETVTALRDALAERPTPKDAAAEPLVFVTMHGNPWADAGSASAVSHEFGKLLKRLEIVRPGVGFYSLRHSFRTVADAVHDLNAIRTVMGHTDDSIDATYTHAIADARIEAVTDHVRAWLFAEQKGGAK